MNKNMGKLDRMIRILLGCGFFMVGALWSQLIIPLKLFLFLWGGVFIITSLFGY